MWVGLTSKVERLDYSHLPRVYTKTCILIKHTHVKLVKTFVKTNKLHKLSEYNFTFMTIATHIQTVERLMKENQSKYIKETRNEVQKKL